MPKNTLSYPKVICSLPPSKGNTPSSFFASAPNSAAPLDEILEESISWSITKDTVFDIGGYFIIKPITRDSVLVKNYIPNSPDTTETNLDKEIWWEVWSKNPPTYHPDWSNAYLNLYRN